ncbi:MAG TPA: bifunctional tetrahydrofolate synthase/dihydrofolate synthase [Quisquiliibacterium sp.]|nr:bifunctional tetrahydrofolate synthase/dihydrofolate synthase [Quisquiliibacterium sp.]
MSGETLPATLAGWLAWIERLHPKTIELGLDRLRTVAERLQLRLDCTVITVAGTNGKGSTCAMLEAILLQAGYRVALYTSPHLVHFNERARLDGQPASDEQLLPHFEAVERARGDTRLTYFEFTTLAILRLFAQASPDVAILEVGLGGRLDAVNLIDADCAIVTCVDIDHTEFLGDTRELIGWEKAHVFRSGRPAICSDPVPPASLVGYASEIGADLWLFGRDFNYSGDRQQWSYGGRGQRRNSLAYPALRGANQLLNASGVLAALEALRERLPVTQQAVRQGFAVVDLPGRFQVLPGRPTVVLDVAHNPHAAAHLANNLDGMGAFRRTWGVFGAMADKDIEAIVGHLKDRIDHWLVAGLPGGRAAAPEALVARLAAAGVTHGGERIVEAHATPREALASAQERAGQDDRIVVFGSFLTVADVLEARARRG